MIGWKCKIGYCPRTHTSLSSCTFTDDGIWVLPEFPDNYYQDNYEDLNIMASDIEKYVGNDYYTCYAYAFYNDIREDEIKTLESIVPSIFKMAPNLVEYLKNNTVEYFICYIPGLKRAIGAIPDNGAKHGFKVNNDGSFSGIGDSMQNQFGITSSATYSASGISIAVYGVRLGFTDISDPTQYCKISIRSSRYGKWWSIDSNSQNEGIEAYKEFWSDYVPPDISTPSNPYEPGGSSGEGGGNGTFDGDSDQITDSSLPTLSSADTGFTRLYTPTLSQVQSLARYLWTDESIVETLWNVVKRYFEDPMQAFISFSIVPVPVPIGGQEEFKVLFIPTGVMLNTVANQFVDVDCGTFELKEYYGSALDYSPNTKVSCYLPYIGTVSLNTDDVMSRTLQVKYRVDICSGSCVAKILVDGNAIYQFPGCCSIPIPFSSSDFSSYGSAIISAVKTGVAVAAAGAGMTELGASVIGMDASQQSGKSITTTVQTARNPSTGRQITTGTEKVTKEIIGTEASLSGIAQTGISNTANSVTASKTIVERSGSFSGNSGYLGVRRPYLIIERPRMCMPANYQSLNGFPSMITLELGSCKGFTRVQQVQLTGFYATNPEQAEILQLLKSGVIF